MNLENYVEACESGKAFSASFGVGYERYSGTARVTDGYAAGHGWIQVSFDSGELAGQRIWLSEEGELVYWSTCEDDQTLFNWGEDYEHPYSEGGALVTALNGATLTLA